MSSTSLATGKRRENYIAMLSNISHMIHQLIDAKTSRRLCILEDRTKAFEIYPNGYYSDKNTFVPLFVKDQLDGEAYDSFMATFMKNYFNNSSKNRWNMFRIPQVTGGEFDEYLVEEKVLSYVITELIEDIHTIDYWQMHALRWDKNTWWPSLSRDLIDIATSMDWIIIMATKCTPDQQLAFDVLAPKWIWRISTYK
jgi:hypothetical protein